MRYAVLVVEFSGGPPSIHLGRGEFASINLPSARVVAWCPGNDYSEAVDGFIESETSEA